MKSSENIGDYFTRILNLTNLVKAYGEQMQDRLIVQKVMCTLLPKFHYIVVAIEESKDLSTMKREELQVSLQAHEQRLLERSNEKSQHQALQVHVTKGKGTNKGKKLERKGRGRSWKGSHYGKSYQDNSSGETDQGDSSYKKGEGNSSAKEGGKRKFDKNKGEVL